MTMRKPTILFLWAISFIVALAVPGSTALAQTTTLATTFTYQGYLSNAGGPVTGSCDFEFRLFNAAVGSGQIGSTLTKTAIVVNNGVFNVQLDFGGAAFDGTDRFLDIQVRCPAGGGVYTPLTPRQALTPAPAAIFAGKSAWGGLSGVPAGFVDGLDNDTLGGLTCANQQIPKWNGTAWACAADNLGSAWELTGNAGTTPGTNFLGTTDNQPLDLRVDNLRALRLEPNVFSPNVIGGFNGNTITPGVFGAFIGGGGTTSLTNRVTDVYGVVAGGHNNQAGDSTGTTGDKQNATVGGGFSNTASGSQATVGGGAANTASGSQATVSGGDTNTASGSQATVGGGAANTASGQGATVGGGGDNTASGLHATVPGGSNNTAAGNLSFAAGRQAKANHNGAFVWGDNTAADVASTGVNQFIARASGGATFYSSADLSTGVTLAGGSGSWAAVSDRNVKANFTPVDSRIVLDKVIALPLSTWNYQAQDTSIRHIGPMAQDFAAAFGVGEDDKHISTVDADGVALAAIQGLYSLVKTENAALKTENAQLKQQVSDLDKRLTALEKLAGTSPASPEKSALPSWLLIGGLVSGGVFIWRRGRGLAWR